MNQATREILWNIPVSFKYLMYILFTLGLYMLGKGMFQKYIFVTGKKGRSQIFGAEGLLPGGGKNLNWRNFLQTIFFQGKVTRHGLPGIFHALIYYGFIILWVATDLVAIHFDTPFKVFQGTTYIVISFLADMAGIAIILGLCLAYYRRYIKKPNFLAATHPRNELFMYAVLLNLVLVGFALEGIRILGTNNEFTQSMINEKSWAPVGWLLAQGFELCHFSDSTLAMLYRILWLFHMMSTMAFIASIPYSKFSHILLTPISALITPPRRGAILNPMNFENENAETFGLGKISELTAKQRFDTLVCVECGRCTQACPANMAGKNLNPKTIVTKMRDFIQSQPDPVESQASFWDLETPLFQANELDACTTCGACMEECPVNIEHVDIIMNLKRYKTLTLGEIPPSAADTVNKIRLNGNPWGISQEDRFKWSDGLEVPVANPAQKIDYLYYVGCAGSYDASNQKVVRDTVLLLKKANVSFAVMGKTEKCNGDPIRRFGDEYSFYEVAIENIAKMRQYQFDKVVTHCPHCLHTIGKEYAKFEDGQFTTIHHTELLAHLVREGKLVPQKTLVEERTYHDPCYLGRHHGQYDAPRDILEAIPGITLKEMQRSKDTSLCCGMGGGNMWYELPEGEHLANNRLHDIAQTQVQQLSTACSFCMINFHSAKGHNAKTENMQIEDIASTLARSVLSNE